MPTRRAPIPASGCGPAAWYRTRLARHFRSVGGGLLVRRGYEPLLWELERPW